MEKIMFRKRIFALLFFLVIPVFATHVAVLETIAPKEVLSFEEKQYLTDVLRSEAVKALPAELNYTIMTRENIIAMLPPGKSVDDCEGSCLVETGKNIAADYVAQGHVGRFANNLTITVELYETAGNKLMGSFSTKATNIENLELQIHQKSSELFSKIVVNSYGKLELNPVLKKNVGDEEDLVVKIDGQMQMDGKKYSRGIWKVVPGMHEIEFIHKCYETQNFKVNVQSGKTTVVNNVMELSMKNLSLTTDARGVFREMPVFVDGVKVGKTPFKGNVSTCAKIEVGEGDSRETIVLDWNGKNAIHIRHNVKHGGLIPQKEQNFDPINLGERIPAEEISAEEKFSDKKFHSSSEGGKHYRLTKPISIAMAVLGIVSVGIGIYANSYALSKRSEYDQAAFKNKQQFDDLWQSVETAKTNRNKLYVLGIGLISGAAIVYFVF